MNNPVYYLLQPDQTLHCRFARGYFLAFSLNISPAIYILMFVQADYLI